MKKIYLMAFSALMAVSANAQTFSVGTVAGPDRNSGNCGGVTDVDNDGRADILILDQSKQLYVAYQQADGSFETHYYGQVSNSSQWGMAVGDVDNDGWADVMTGGSYDDVKIVNINGYDSYTMDTYAWADIFMQACNFADIDNDGFLDGFACHDDGHNAILHNNTTGGFVNGVGMIDMVFYPEVPGGNDNSGNYGTVWCDFDRDGDIDLLIAKCRQFINDPYDPRRTNILLVNDGNNNYSDEAPERGLVNLQQSWTADFADIDNDGDFDCFLTTHSGTLEIYENDGFGYFTEITAGSGLEVSGFFLQGKLADFDNDGYVDVLHAGGAHGYYHNNGNKTWTLVQNTFDNNDTMHSFGIGDLNHDGFLDLYATYGNSYVTPDNAHPNKLFINDGNNNNWVVFDLEGTISNKQAVGAVVEIHGSFGTQIRDVRAGESYGITNTNQLHFGLGAAESVDYAIIHWPAGGTYVIENPAINTFHDVVEGVCPDYSVSISVVGSSTGCPITLQANETFSNYIWSNAANSNMTEAYSDGVYSVVVYDENGCGSISNSIEVDVTEDPAPTVAINGETSFCAGGSVTLTSSEGLSYLWSNGEDTQAIEVTESGTYYVDVTAGCGTQRTIYIDVDVLETTLPVAADQSVQLGTSATLEATGQNITWYDGSSNVLGTGNSYTTDPLNSNTTFYVTNTVTYGGDVNGGKADFVSNEGNFLTNSNFYLKFDAFEEFTLVSVDVNANSAGSRTIELVDAAANVLQSATVDVPQGESTVTLNFTVPAGSNMGLRSQSGTNPNMWRDKDLTTGAPFGFPYALGTSGAITGTNVSGADFDNYYYFYYNWMISTPEVSCESAQVPVVVSVITAVEEVEGIENLNVYPNPTSSILNVQFSNTASGKVDVRLVDATGRVIIASNINNGVGKQNVQMNLEGVAAGVYQLEINVNGNTSVSKVIVE
ncbi:MAG: FG-GAP-like repeat-containing protein [Flavobacteriales bacterium]